MFEVQSIEIGINPIKILIFQEIPFRFALYQGTIKGSVKIYPDYSIHFAGDGIQPNRNVPLRKTNIITSRPTLDIKGQFIKTDQIKGSINVMVKELGLSGKKEITHIPFELPETRFESVDARIALKNKILEISTKSTGDVSFQVNGTIKQNWKRIVNSKLDLKIKATMTPIYQKKLGFIHDILKSYMNKSGQISIKVAGNPRYPQIERI